VYNIYIDTYIDMYVYPIYGPMWMRYKRAGDIRVCVCVFRMCGEADDSPKGTFSMDVHICICTFIYIHVDLVCMRRK